jgi:hypothetical protein
MTKCATLWGGQFEGIFEDLTEKMNHEEHEGTRNLVELLRVPSWFIQCPREPRAPIELTAADAFLGSHV